MTRPSRPPGRERGSGPVTTPARPLTTPTPQPPGRAVTSSINGGTDSGRDAARACSAPGCSRPLPAGRRRYCCDLCQRRGQRAGHRTETSEFGQMLARMITALARRVGATDADELAVLWEARDALDAAAAAAVDQLRTRGFTWGALAAATGMTPQGMQQWRTRPRPPVRHQQMLTDSRRGGAPC